MSLAIDPQKFPQLPPITSQQILTQVYTHRGTYGRPVHQFEDSPDDPAPDNESLEHLGDSVLGFIITTLIRDMYPHIRVGPATKIRERAVKNPNLAVLAVGYKMHESLRTHPSQTVALRASPSIQADLFESYVGGLYLSEGLEVTRTWLSALFRPCIVDAYSAVRADYHPSAPQPSGASLPLPSESTETVLSVTDITGSMEAMDINSSKSSKEPEETPPPVSPPSTKSTPNHLPFGYLMMFNEYVEKNNLTIQWSSDRLGGTDGGESHWELQIILQDECIGSGKGRSKQVAKHEAALEALKKLGVIPNT